MNSKTFNKIKFISYIIGFIIFVSHFKMVMANDDDDDDSLFLELIRILFEIFIGFCIESCHQNPTCNYYLIRLSLIIIIIAIISIFFSGKKPRLNGRVVQSGLNVYIGMRLARK